jgi:endoglucanase
LCKVPGAGEIGDFVSAQMAAVNVQGDFVTVSKAGTGGGNVDSADKRIACGNKCTSPYTAGTLVSLAAKANSGSTFAGWTGACTGTGACTVTVNGANNVGANFTLIPAGGGGGGGGGTTPTGYQLKVSASNSGTVTSNSGGINCGTACNATYAPGTVVTLTATPPAGKTFSAWSGACTGSANTCTVTVNATLQVKANFNK